MYDNYRSSQIETSGIRWFSIMDLQISSGLRLKPHMFLNFRVRFHLLNCLRVNVHVPHVSVMKLYLPHIKGDILLLCVQIGNIAQGFFVSKMPEKITQWGEVCFLHLSNIIRMFQARRRQWTGQVACMGRKRNNWHRILVEKFEGGELLERPMDRWKNNVKVYLKK